MSRKTYVCKAGKGCGHSGMHCASWRSEYLPKHLDGHLHHALSLETSDLPRPCDVVTCPTPDASADYHHAMAAGSTRQCPPRRLMHLEPFFLDVNGIYDMASIV